MRHAKSRVEEFQQRLKQRIQASVPALCIIGLTLFSLGVGKAYNWKIGLCVLIVLVTIFVSGYRLLEKLSNPKKEEQLTYTADAARYIWPSQDPGPTKRPGGSLAPEVYNVVSNNDGKRTA